MPTKRGKKLTVKGIAALSRRPERYSVFDGHTGGLQVRVSPDGRKVFALHYRFAKKMRQDTLGPFIEDAYHEAEDADRNIGTLAWARREAERRKDLAKAGRDPHEVIEAERAEARAEDAAKRDAPTFGKLAETWFAQKTKLERRGSEVEAIIRRECKQWWERTAAGITSEDVTELLDAIVARGSPSTAVGLRRILHRHFKWAKTRRGPAVNPAKDIPLPKLISRDRTLSDDEVRAILGALDKDPSGRFERIVRLLLLTGQRRGEVAQMAWSRIDFGAATWTIPASVAKNGVEHVVPLTDAALAVIGKAPPKKERKSDYVFADADGNLPSGWSRMKARLDTRIRKGGHDAELLDKLLGDDTNWRLHDLRRTFATGLHALGVDTIVVERTLNHSLVGVQAVYNRHGFADEMRKALSAWARRVRELQNPSTTNVVELARA